MFSSISLTPVESGDMGRTFRKISIFRIYTERNGCQLILENIYFPKFNNLCRRTSRIAKHQK
jgi:hypothetical protein